MILSAPLPIDQIHPALQRKMIDSSGGFFEWHRPDGSPHGAAGFRGAAGVFAKAAEMLGRNAG